jgi:hypothetical protein
MARYRGQLTEQVARLLPDGWLLEIPAVHPGLHVLRRPRRASLVIYAGVADLRLTGPKLETGLGPSRRRVYTLAALFAVDAFGGGFIVISLLALWLSSDSAYPW